MWNKHKYTAHHISFYMNKLYIVKKLATIFFYGKQYSVKYDVFI